MPHYKDQENRLYWLDDAAFAHMLPDGCVEITDAEADQLRRPTPEQAKAGKWLEIKAERERRKAGGVKVAGKWFHSDDASRIQQLGLVMMGANLPAGLQWKTMDGSFITMTPAIAQQVFTGQAASDQAIFAAAEAHKAAMEASADPSAYDFSGGWPAIFAG